MGSEIESAATIVEGPSIEPLLHRAYTLLDELIRFKKHAARPPYRQRDIPMREFEGGIKAEITHLEKLASRPPDRSDEPSSGTAGQLSVRNSNLPAYDLLWNMAKSCRSISAFRQWYRLNPSTKGRRAEIKSKRVQRALVDIVCADGQEWIKVSSITHHRVLFDFAKDGWHGGGVSESESESQLENGIGSASGHGEVPEIEIPLLRNAKDLVAASKVNRFRGRVPHVKIVLPRVQRGASREVDILLAKIEEVGCILDLTNGASPEPDLDQVINLMPIDPYARLSATLNVDCTILISLISDISHVKDLQPESWYNAMLLEQLKFEKQEPLLPNILYPVLKRRRLVTTQAAATQCILIVETIGNESEKGRCDILLSSRDNGKAREMLAKLSDHDVPADLYLPVEIMTDDVTPADAEPRSKLSERLVQRVCADLSKINGSVFGFGWNTGWTTVTSNNITIKEVENLLEKHRANDGSEDEVAAPETWSCLPRSVVGKYDQVRQDRKSKRNIGKELRFEANGAV